MFVFSDDSFVTYKRIKAYNCDELEDVEISQMKKNGKFLKLTLYFKDYNKNCVSILIRKTSWDEIDTFLKSKNIKINYNIEILDTLLNGK